MNFVIIPALLGPLLGPTVGGLIVHWFTWREIFFVNIPVGLLALWFAKNYMPNYQSDTRRPLDVRGLILFASGAGLLSWLLEVLGEINLPIGMVVMLLAAYGWHARRVPYPLLRLSLFATRTFRVSVLGGFATRLGVGVCHFCCRCSTIASYSLVGPGTLLYVIVAMGLALGLFNSLHHAFLALSVLTVVSSVAFWTLRPQDGESVSKGSLGASA